MNISIEGKTINIYNFGIDFNNPNYGRLSIEINYTDYQYFIDWLNAVMTINGHSKRTLKFRNEIFFGAFVVSMDYNMNGNNNVDIVFDSYQNGNSYYDEEKKLRKKKLKTILNEDKN